MKTITTVLSVLLISLTAFSATTNEQPKNKFTNEVFNQLRESFLSAEIPQESDLKVGRLWYCKVIRGDYNATLAPFDISFTKLRTEFYGVRWDDGMQTAGITDFGRMNLIPAKGLFGIYTHPNRYSSATLIRKSKSGELVIEGSAVYSQAPVFYDSSLGKPYGALYYASCISE